MIENVVIIGAGNLATQLALALVEKDIKVKQVFSRKEQSALKLAQKLSAEFTTDLSNLINDADLYIIAVKDSAILEVMEGLRLAEDRFIVHTAGSVPMDVLEGFSDNYGVFYPLQTFSKTRKIDFSDIPVCIEANHPANLLKLEKLAARLSSSVNQINSGERKTLHLAAVFVNNFVNHFYAIGADILSDKKMNFDLLKPLIRETAEKVQILHPADAQTGPAKRYDQNIIEGQLKMLHNEPEYQKIYSFVSESIFQFQKKYHHDLL